MAGVNFPLPPAHGGDGEDFWRGSTSSGSNCSPHQFLREINLAARPNFDNSIEPPFYGTDFLLHDLFFCPDDFLSAARVLRDKFSCAATIFRRIAA